MISRINPLVAWPTLGLVLLSLTVAAADYAPANLRGRRVRVTAPQFSARVVEGRAASLSNDTLRLEDCRPDLDLEIIPLSTISRVQVYDGQRSHTILGALIGAGAGLATWGVIESVDSEPEDGWFEGLDRTLSTLMAVVLVAGGTVTGGVVGTLITTDRWREVPKDQLQFSLTPMAGKRVGLSLTMRF